MYEDKEKVAEMALHFIRNNPYDTPEELIENIIPCRSESMIERMIESLEAWDYNDESFLLPDDSEFDSAKSAEAPFKHHKGKRRIIIT